MDDKRKEAEAARAVEEEKKIRDPTVQALEDWIKRRKRKFSREGEGEMETDTVESWAEVASKMKKPNGTEHRTEHRTEQRTKNWKLGILSDSNLNGFARNVGWEATFLEKGCEHMIRFAAEATVDELSSVPERTYDQANAMLICIGQKDIKKNWKRNGSEDENDRMVTRVADKVTDLIGRYVKRGKSVMYVSPPITRNSEDEQEVKLERAVEAWLREKNMQNETSIVRLASQMKRELEMEGNREEVMARWLATDGNHMNKQAFEDRMASPMRTIFQWERTMNGNDEVIRITQLKRKQAGICRVCGRNGCWGQLCKNERVYCDYCKRDTHANEACSILNYRPCITCGNSGRHIRRPCTGWW